MPDGLSLAEACIRLAPSEVLAAGLEPPGVSCCWFLFGASAIQYVTWVGGTVAGALGGDLLGDPQRLGLDAIFPTFFLALLLGELRDRRAWPVAALGALIALALVPVAPPGVPVLAASVAALAGLRRTGST